MSKATKCWICENINGPFYIKGFGTENEISLCGSCCGVFSVVESRLYAISKWGKLDSCFTAEDASVPIEERDNSNENNTREDDDYN